MLLLGMDSGRYPAPREVDEIVLTTGNRADLLVTTAAAAANCVPCPTTAAAWPR